MNSLGLYVHIPFCAAICPYCNFNRGLLDEALAVRYVDALEREIARQAEWLHGRRPAEAADTLYFGGGTPSLLEPAQVARLVGACRDGFGLAPDPEITLEANPESVTAERLAGLRDAGVNRLSLGVQSFRDEELVRLGRLHHAARAQEAYRAARAEGFDNVSLDLMMWLPQQSMEQWRDSVAALVGLQPDHASLYMLELYPNAPLREQMARAGWSLAPDDDGADMYEWAMESLEAAGYEHYEISNVARPSRRARHNLKYWTDGEWIGFGCGAHSTFDGVRWKNVSATEDYVERVREGLDLAVERRALSPRERIEEALFMGLRLRDGIDLGAFRDRYAVDVWQEYGERLTPHLDAGFIVRDDGRLRLTRQGMLMSQEVFAVFIDAAVR
jgi:oxygen-independent coproporphyrinogen-3 oxidase